MRRNKLKVLSSLAILGIAGLGLAACNNNTGSGTTPSPTPTPTENGGGATTTPTPTPVPTTPSQTTTTTPNQSSTANTPAQKVVKSISISGGKTLYLVGEEFSFDGVVVTKTYNDETQETATADEVTYKIYSDEDGTKEATSIATAGTYYVYVTCGGKDNYYAITVQEKQQTIHELTGFGSLGYNEGSITENKELYNKNNNKINLTADAKSKVEYNKSGEKYDDISFTHRVKFGGQTIKGEQTLDIAADGTLNTKGAISIRVEHAGTIKLYAKSSGDQKRFITLTNNSDYTKSALTTDKKACGCIEFKVEAGTYYLYQGDVDTNSSLVVGETVAKNGTVYTGGWYLYGIGIEYEVPVSSVTYSEIKVDTSNAKTDFNKGDEFATTGLVVKGLNNYGVWDILDSSDYTITNEDGSAVDTTTVGRKTLKVTAKGHSDTYVIQVINPNATLDKIEVKDHAKEVYKKGEEISLSGLTITTTDSDTLTQDIAYDAEKITYKVLDGETDVTSSFTTLTKGTYKVELTYASKTTTYDITMLEVKEGKFDYKNEVAVGSDSYASSLIISYTDGTDADWSKYNETILSTAEGYSTKFYSDADCTALIDTATNAFASVGTVYMKLSYQDYSSNAITLTVKNFNSESYSTSGLTAGKDYKNSVLFEGNLVDVKIGTGTCKADSDPAINQGEMQIKLDKEAGKEIIFVVKQRITLKIIANASGNKKYIIKDAAGTELKAGDLSKTADGDTTIEITLEAGTYSFTSNGGGVRFAGIEATKAE